MKLTLSIFLLHLCSILIAQKDSVTNFFQLPQSDSLITIEIESNKKYLFSDSTYIFPFYNQLPRSVVSFQKNNPDKLFHTTTTLDFEEINSRLIKINQSETFLFYQMGSSNSQYLFLDHLQKINKSVSATTNYTRNKSDGFYLNQTGISEQLNFLLNFKKDSSRYLLQPYFHYRNYTQHENAGIKSDNIFKAGDFVSSLFLETNSSTAKNSGNVFSGGIHQLFSSQSQKWKFHHELGFQNQKRNFIYDPGDSIYTTIYLDTITTNDKYFTENYFNKLSFNLKNRNANFALGIKNEILNYSQNDFDTSSFENKFFTKTNYSRKKTNLNFDLNYILSGFNTGNFSTKLQLNIIDQKHFSSLQFTSVVLNQNPDIFFSRMNSNHFQWNYFLKKLFIIRHNINAKSKLGEVDLTHEMIQNYAYLNELIEVNQTEENLQRIEINYHFDLDKKKIYWRNEIIYQNVFSGENYFRVPDFTLRSEFRFKTKLKAMQLNFGIIANYCTSYYANAYDPALEKFYLQNEITVGNYPILDFYIFSTIKTVDLKFTLSHFNSGFTGYNYYSTPLYPIAPRAFYFGLSWHFTD